MCGHIWLWSSMYWARYHTGLQHLHVFVCVVSRLAGFDLLMFNIILHTKCYLADRTLKKQLLPTITKDEFPNGARNRVWYRPLSRKE